MNGARPAADEIARTVRALVPEATIASARHVPWMSATFEGMRHDLLLRGVPADRVAALCHDLAATAFDLRGHIVADIVAVAEGDGLRIEALTITDAA